MTSFRPLTSPAPRTPARTTHMSTTRTAPGTVTGVLPWIALAGGIGVQFADVMLAKAVLDVVVNINETISWIVAISISLVADLAAIWAGRARATGHKAEMWTSLGVWAALGLAIFLVRWNAHSLGDVNSGPTADKIVAVLTGALYLAAGTTCLHAAQVLFDPVRAQYRASGRTITDLRTILHTKEAVYTRLDQTLATYRTERDIYRTERAAHAHATAEALEARLKDHARQQILAHLDTPTAAPLVRAPHHPHPADLVTTA